MIGPSETSGIEIKSEYQLTGHPVYTDFSHHRFTDGAGTKLATSLVKSKHCGTFATGYLKDGTSALPSSPGDEVEATVCFYDGSSNPCYNPTAIKIKKCRNFWMLQTTKCSAL